MNLAILDVSTSIPFIPWLPDNIEQRLVNANSNFYTNMNYYLTTKFSTLNKYLIDDGIRLFVDNDATNYFADNDFFFKSTYSLNVNGNIILNHDENWSTTYKLDQHIELKDKITKESIITNKLTMVTFNYTVFPNASLYTNMDKYYINMRATTRLSLFALYNSEINGLDNQKHKIIVWNPCGLGAFLNNYKGDKEEVKKKVTHILFDEYSKGKFPNSTLVFVGSEDLLGDNTFTKIQEIYNNSFTKDAEKSIIYVVGDMLSVAKIYASKGNFDVSVSMSADVVGPGNRFFMMPSVIPGNARNASDENNTRRSNIMWKIVLLNLYFLVKIKGREELFGNSTNTSIVKKLKLMYTTKQRKNLLEVMKSLDPKLVYYVNL